MGRIFTIISPRAPKFDDLDLKGTIISKDWFSHPVPGIVDYLFWLDETHFHFLARHQGSSSLSHPESEPNTYRTELWKYDVAEFFLQSPDRSRYLEFNLAPNGSWWSCIFNSPRNPAPDQPAPIPGVTTLASQDENSWQAMASLPRPWLESHFDLGERTSLNTTFILKSPCQIFLTSADLGKGEPDFHRPDRFPDINLVSLA